MDKGTGFTGPQELGPVKCCGQVQPQGARAEGTWLAATPLLQGMAAGLAQGWGLEAGPGAA